MALTQDQINSFTIKAKQAGYSDAEIQAEISRKQAEVSAVTPTPTQPTQQVQQPTQSPFENTNAKVKLVDSSTQQPDPEQAVRQDKGIIKSFMDFIAPKASAVGSMVVNPLLMGKDYVEYKMAKTPEEKQKQLVEYNQKRQKTVDAQKQFGFDADKQGNQFDPVQYAKGTAQGAAEAASFAIPAGKTLKGAALLGGASGALRGASESENLSDVLPNITTGAIGGAAGGAIMNKAFSALSSILKKSGANMALRSLRPSKTQITKFGKETGEDLTDFVIKNKLYNNGTSQVDELIKPLQQGYDELALNSGAQVRRDAIESAFNNKIAELEKIPNSQIKGIAEQLKAERDLLLSSIKDTTGIDFITKTRRSIDDLIPNSKFAQDPIAAGKTRIVRDIYKNIIDDATGGKTAQIGNELKKMYAFRDIAELQENLGKGNLPAGLLPLIAGGAGFSQGETMKDRIRNAALLSMLTAGLNNPKIISLATDTLINLGNKIEQSQLPTIIGRTGGAMLGNQIVQNDSGDNSQRPPDINTNNSQYTEKQYTTQVTPGIVHNNTGNLQQDSSIPQDTLPNIDVGTPQTLNQWGATPEVLYREYQNAMIAGDKATASWLYNLYNDEVAYQEKKAKKGKDSFTSTQLKELSDIQISVDQMQNLNPLIDQYEDIMGPVRGRIGGSNPYSTEAQTFNSQMKAVAQQVGKAMEGGVLRKEDEEKYRQMLPNIYDTPQVARAKIESVKQMLQNQLQTKQNMYSTSDVIPDYGGMPLPDINTSTQ